MITSTPPIGIILVPIFIVGVLSIGVNTYLDVKERKESVRINLKKDTVVCVGMNGPDQEGWTRMHAADKFAMRDVKYAQQFEVQLAKPTLECSIVGKPSIKWTATEHWWRRK